MYARILLAASAAAAALTMSLTACDRAAAPRASAAANDPPTAARSPRALWQTYCASCHGPTGRGSPVATVSFDSSWQRTRSDSLIRARITNGVPNTTMAPWGRMLSAAEVDRLVTYVRGLGGR